MLTNKELDEIFIKLEKCMPKLNLTLGVNNKTTYFEADRIYDILRTYTIDEETEELLDKVLKVKRKSSNNN